jgi:hypothetical protein
VLAPEFKMSFHGRRIFGLDTRKHFFFGHAYRIQSVAERIGG